MKQYSIVSSVRVPKINRLARLPECIEAEKAYFRTVEAEF
jgi:hypothetical protein